MIYRVTTEGGNDVIDKVTSNNSMVLAGLNQLTRYKIKVQAQEKINGFSIASATVRFTTLGVLAFF